MVFSRKFHQKLAVAFIATILVVTTLFSVSFVSNAQQINIAESLCAGANLDYSGINGSGSCTAASLETSSVQLNNLVTSLISLLSWGIGVIAVFMIIVGGFKYITSGGDSTGVTAAKNTILYAIIGLIIVALAQVIVRFILSRIANVGLN